MDVNVSVENPAVVAAIENFAREQNPRTELDLLQTIGRARFICPVKLDQPVVDGKVPDNTGVQQYTITNTENEQFFIVFTDETALARWGNGNHHDFVQISIAEVLECILQSEKAGVAGVIVNPMTHDLAMSRQMLTGMPERCEQLLKAVPPRYLMGTPRKEPFKLEKRLHAYFEQYVRAVRSAWMLVALKEGEEDPIHMLIIDYEGTEEEARKFYPGILEDARKCMTKKEKMEIMCRGGKFVEDILADAMPFYQR